MINDKSGTVNMGEVNVLVYVVIVGFLGLVAAALAFAAEATKIKVSDVSITQPGNCNYPRNSAYILGYSAALLTLIVEIIIIAIARCACCDRNIINNTPTFQPGSINCYILSCFGAAIGISFLLSAANLSSRQQFLASTGVCYTVKPGIFAAGGALSLLACILGLCSSYYFSVIRRNSAATLVLHQDGVPMTNITFDAATTYSNPKQQHV